jgi:hypothetical protein
VLENLHRFLDALPDNKAWDIRIKLYRRSRSDNQNAALWRVAYPPLCEHTGYLAEELHEAMCIGFFGGVEYEVMGVPKIRPRRTTTKDEDGKRDVLDTKAFSEFFAYVQQRGAECGVFIPDPDPMRRAA